MAGGDWLVPVIGLYAFYKIAGKYAAAGGGGSAGADGFTVPNVAEITVSAGPEVFAGVDSATAIAAVGTTYQDKPPGWSSLDWEDFLRGV